MFYILHHIFCNDSITSPYIEYLNVFSFTVPNTFLDLLHGIEKAIYRDGDLDPRIAVVIKEQLCFNNNVGNNKKFIDKYIISKDGWVVKFYNCLYVINAQDISETEDDLQKFRFMTLI